MTFWEKLFLLFGALWCFILAFMYYTWKLQKRQQAILRYIAYRLTALEQLLSPQKTPPQEPPAPQQQTQTTTVSTPETVITIDKSEPLSKYESVQLPDEINIHFVDR